MDTENFDVIIDGNRTIYKNKSRMDYSGTPFFTITTPVYNRTATIRRTIQSVENQTFRDFEYIIVDDGSTDDLDPIIFDFMENTNIPVTYAKKPNGGVHTARNLAIDIAVGEYIIFLDSDDELLPNACRIFHREWIRIPSEKRSSYFQVKALCIDENGTIQGTPFPENINFLPHDEAMPYFSGKGAKIGCRSLLIMKNHRFPEPEGVRFLFESNQWGILETEYSSWGTNDVVVIYHREGDDHLSSRNKEHNLQFCKDDFWMRAYRLNQPKYFKYTLKERKWNIRRYYSMYLKIRSVDLEFVKRYRLSGFMNNLFLFIRKVSHSSHSIFLKMLKR